MREIPTLRISLFLVFLVLFLCIVPVSAYVSAGNGTFASAPETIQHVYSLTNAYISVGYRPLNAIHVPEISAVPNFGAIKMFTTSTGNGYFATSSSINDSYISANLTDEITGTIISTGLLGYSRNSIHGEQFYVYYFPQVWDTGTLTGPRTLLLAYDTSAFILSSKSYGIESTVYNEPCFWSTTSIACIDEDYQYVSELNTEFYHKYDVYKESTSDLFYTINITKQFPAGHTATQFWSSVKINVSTGLISTNIFTGFGITNINIPGISTSMFPVELNITDAMNNLYYAVIYGPAATNLAVNIDKGQYSNDLLPADTSTTARLSGSNGAGIKYLLWEWSENYDDKKSSTSNYKQYSPHTRLFAFNSTNTSSSYGPWELVSDTFEAKPSPVTLSVNRGAYSWNQVKSQTVQFNWSSSDPSWIDQPSYTYPYNFVKALILDNSGLPIGSATRPVYVSTPLGSSQFEILIVNYDSMAKIADSNLYVFDSEADPATWVVRGENLTVGHAVVEVNASHVHYIWPKKAGYRFVDSMEISTRTHQFPVGGCVTYSAPSIGLKVLYLYMAHTAGANYTILFQVEGTNGAWIPNAKISVTSHQSSDIIYTGTTGTVLFNTIPDLDYKYTVDGPTGGGFCFVSEHGAFNSYGDSNLRVVLYSCGEITTQPTITTGPPTPTPTQTYLPGPGEEGGNIFTWFIRLFQIAGAGSVSNAKLMLALIICAVLAFFFGYYISYQASLIGAFVGFIFSLAFGLIPMWILIAIIFVGGIFFVGKWWSGVDGGG